MGNPKLQDGYTKIANELLDALCQTRVSGESRQVLDAIIRKTYGFNKKSDMISLSQLCIMTDLTKSTVCRAIRTLKMRNMIITKPRGYCTEYEINKKYSEWEKAKGYDRLAIFKRDGYMCHICHSVKDATELDVDHVVPLWLNGSNKDENLATCCSTCNRRKGADRLRHKIDTVSELPPSQKVKRKGGKIANKPVTKMPQTKESKEITKDNTHATAPKEQLQADQWRVLIDGFKDVNPMYEGFYKMKTQRGALQDVVRAIGYEKTVWIITNLKKVTSMLYAPKITTPMQLKAKLGELQTFLTQQRQKQQSIITKNTTRVGKL